MNWNGFPENPESMWVFFPILRETPEAYSTESQGHQGNEIPGHAYMPDVPFSILVPWTGFILFILVPISRICCEFVSIKIKIQRQKARFLPNSASVENPRLAPSPHLAVEGLSAAPPPTPGCPHAFRGLRLVPPDWNPAHWGVLFVLYKCFLGGWIFELVTSILKSGGFT